jgi:hypothetical protein
VLIYLLPLWTLVNAELDAGTELDVTAWRSHLVYA